MADPASPPPAPGPGPMLPSSPDPKATRRTLAVLLAMFVGMWLWKSTAEQRAHEPTVPYSQFFQWVKDGKVTSVVLSGDSLDGRLTQPEKIGERSVQDFHSDLPPNDTALLPLLREKGVKIEVKSQQQPFAVQVIFTLLPWALIIGVWLWISRRAQKMMTKGGPFGLLKSPGRKFEKSKSVATTFNDVAGLKSAKQDLQEIVQFLKEPERFRRLGGKVPRGVLLIGPPGTGKTLLARAVAGESGVAFFSISGSEFIEMFVGLGASRVRDLFQEAKKDAPAIVFIDEIDAVGRARGAGHGMGHDEQEQTLNQLLSEMDGFERNELVVVLAATNRPDVLDPALLRPGRFDRRVVVDRPELAARKAILVVHTQGKPLAPDVDLQRIAADTPGFSGADLANLVNEAALHATRTGRDSIFNVDFMAAYDKIVLGDPRESKLDPEEKKRVAIHESGHAVVAHFTPGAQRPSRVSIIPRGMALGVTQQTPGADRHLMTQSELEARLRVLMGGQAAERLLLSDISTGAENDLKEATNLASKMVAHYGMSDRLGPVYYDYSVDHPFLGRRVAGDGGTSESTVSTIEDEARKLLGRAFEGTADLLAAKRAVLERLVALLLAQETLESAELTAALGGEPAPERVAAAAP
jgi:cell division protease FtsH